MNINLYNRFLNEKELEPSETVIMEVNHKDGTCKLIISDATADMQGEIKAVASNAGGEDLCSAILEVRGQAPTFEESPIKCTILEGKIIAIKEKKMKNTVQPHFNSLS